MPWTLPCLRTLNSTIGTARCRASCPIATNLQTMIPMKAKSLLLIGLLAFVGVRLLAQPSYVNYQGTLNDQDGNPLSSGSYTMDFRLHTNLIGNSAPIWGPFRFDGTVGDGRSEKVNVVKGRFNVILGPKDIAGRPIQGAFSGDACYVEIRVNDDDPILPRQQVLTAPYAFETQNARTVNYIEPVHYLNPPGIIAPFAGAVTKVPPGWLACDGKEFRATDYPGLYATIGMAWGGRTNVISESEVDYFFRVPDLRGMFLRGVNGDRADGWGDPEAGARTNAVPSE
ncbi:tail fiber protein, partial [bacterium]|nr:tail fiber protein [bacterium]